MAAIGLPGMLPAQDERTELAISRLAVMEFNNWYFEAAERFVSEIDIESYPVGRLRLLSDY